MPRSIKRHLEEGASRAKLRKWAKEKVSRWLAAPKHISTKEFTREELVNLTEAVFLVDRAPTNELKEKFLREINNAQRREFGYIAGFVQYIRDRMAAGDGFDLDPELDPRRKVIKRRPSDPKTGKIHFREKMVRQILLDPFLCQKILDEFEKRGVEPGMKDLIAIIESSPSPRGSSTMIVTTTTFAPTKGSGSFSVLSSAAAEATRKRKK